jgi:hypothetical protein
MAELLDAWSDYCAKSYELEQMILDSYTVRFDAEVRKAIAEKRLELDSLLDAMIGGNECDTNTGKA